MKIMMMTEMREKREQEWEEKEIIHDGSLLTFI